MGFVFYHSSVAWWNSSGNAKGNFCPLMANSEWLYFCYLSSVPSVTLQMAYLSAVFFNHFCVGDAKTPHSAWELYFLSTLLIFQVPIAVILSIRHCLYKSWRGWLKLDQNKTNFQHHDGACTVWNLHGAIWVLWIWDSNAAFFYGHGILLQPRAKTLQSYVSRTISVVKRSSESDFGHPFSPELPLGNELKLSPSQ